MRKISKEEASRFMVKRGASGVVRTALTHLQVGEILLIEKKDWKPLNPPGQLLSRIKRRTGMEFKMDIIADGSGWIVERVK